MNNFKKILIFILCGVLIAVGVIASIYIPRRITYKNLKDKYSKSNTPSLYIVPTEKSVQVPTSNSGNEKKTSLYGLKISTTWGSPIETKELNTAVNATSFKYSNNTQLLIMDERYEISYLETLQKEDADGLKAVREFLGRDTLTSKYDFFDALLKESPKQITMSLRKKDLVTKDSLLNVKLLLMPKFEDNIFKYIIGNIKVFQFGSIKSTTKTLTLNVFGDNNASYTLIFKGDNLNQNDIDKIIASLEASNE